MPKCGWPNYLPHHETRRVPLLLMLCMLYCCCLQLSERERDDLDAGMCCSDICRDLCVVVISCAVFLAANVDIGSLVYSAYYYCQRQVFLSFWF